MTIDAKKLFGPFRWLGKSSEYKVLEEGDKLGVSLLAAPRSLEDWQKSATKAATFALEASQVADNKGLAKGDLVLSAAMLLLGTLNHVYHDCGNSRQQVLAVLDLMTTLTLKEVSFAPDPSKLPMTHGPGHGPDVQVSFVELDAMPDEVRSALSRLGIKVRGMPPPGSGSPPSGGLN